MVRKTGIVALVIAFLLTSCSDESGGTKSLKNARATGKDRSVTLLLKDADLMQIDSNPQYNTAEWNFVVEKPGRYDVWLSSLTCDTSNLGFRGNVTITAGDARLEKRPVGDEIITDDKDIKSPWFRADSHMGSVFFSEPGEYQVQVISDKVVRPGKADIKERTRINSLILKPTVN